MIDLDQDTIRAIVDRTCEAQGVPRIPPPDILAKVARGIVDAERRAVMQAAS